MKTSARGLVCLLSAAVLSLSTAFLSGCAGLVSASGTNSQQLAAIQVNPSSVTFGSATVGKKISQTVAVANTGTMTVNIAQATVSNSQFSISGLTMPLSLPAGQSSNFQVSFDPNVPGNVTGTLAVMTDAGVSSEQVALSGTATAAAVGPTITTQPGSQTVTVGQTATFTVVAGGTAPLSYQWQKNGANVAGAITASYTTPTTVTGDSGSTFDAVVSNAAGTVTSAAATLTVTASAVPPTITTQPANQTVTAGQTATFTVVAGGTAPLSYQWQKNGANIAGANTASYATSTTVTGDSGSTFGVVVSNTAGTVTSSAATLTVNAAVVAPTITTQPGNQTVTVGQTATFTVAAGGTAPLSYQWQRSGVNIAGATAASYTTPATVSGDSGSTFRVVVSNTAGMVTSAAATLAVSAVAVPGIQLSSASLSFGNVVDGSNPSQALIITNTGTATLTITQVNETGSAFGVSGYSLPLNVGAGQQTTMTVAFQPTTAGAASGNISIVSNAPSSPTVVSLSGTGVAATFTLSINPASLSFGNVTTGTASAAQNATITNNGNSNVAISQIALSGAGYSMTGGGAAVTLTPTQQLSLSVQFSPTATGSASGSISIVSNASGSPATVSLSGTGVAPVQHSAALSWGASTSTVSGYNVYRSTVSGGPYTLINSSLVAALTYTDTTVQSGTTYYYVTTAVDASGNESLDSNEVAAAIP